MAPQIVIPAGQQALKIPSRLQIAFALAIARSKPDNISIQDHVLQLRACVRRGRQRDVDASRSRHLDSVAYWRSQYDQSQAKCERLESKVVQLEQENDRLKGKHGMETPIPAVSGSTKRKSAGKHSSALPPKRTKLGQGGLLNDFVMPVEDMFEEDEDVIDRTGEAGVKLMQSLYKLHSVFKHPESERAGHKESLCFHLIETIRGIGSVLSLTCRRQFQTRANVNADDNRRNALLNASKAKEEAELASTIRALARAFTSILLGLNQFAAGDDHNRRSGLIVYDCVKMFQTILNSITESALASARTTGIANPEQAATEKSRTPKITRTSKGSTPSTSVSRTLAQFLNAILSYLDHNNVLHRELFEGFMFVLLDRIGKRLYVCTFDRERSATIEADISPPSNLGSAAAGPKREVEKRALRLEVPSLVSILQRAITLAPKHLARRTASGAKMGRRPTAISGTASGKGTVSGNKNALSQHAKDRLQQTLVNCMFGEEDQDGFSDCLRMPARLGTVPAPPKVDDEDIGNWFKSEVWKLVGWELLGKGEDW